MFVALADVWVAFDVTALIEKAKSERAELLARNVVAHNVHSTKDLRNADSIPADEGTLVSSGMDPPDYATVDRHNAAIDLDKGSDVPIEGQRARLRRYHLAGQSP